MKNEFLSISKGIKKIVSLEKLHLFSCLTFFWQLTVLEKNFNKGIFKNSIELAFFVILEYYLDKKDFRK